MTDCIIYLPTPWRDQTIAQSLAILHRSSCMVAVARQPADTCPQLKVPCTVRGEYSWILFLFGFKLQSETIILVARNHVIVNLMVALKSV